jgi:creatinine amidohydrolase
MKLVEATWQDVAAWAAEPDDKVCLIPTGSLEQHGGHLPLFTDSIIVTAVAEAVEAIHRDCVLLTPTLWLGCSAHHMAFSGSLTASYSGYSAALESVVQSLRQHGFHKFYVLNGHGGNSDSNRIACRSLREAMPDISIGTAGWYEFAGDTISEVLEGPQKDIRHACEAEASVIMHLAPGLVRHDKLRDDGLACTPDVKGLVWRFDEMTEAGSLGYASLATSEKGKLIFEAAVEECAEQMGAFSAGVILIGGDMAG